VFEGCTDAERPKQRFDEESPVNLIGGYLWSCNFAISKNIFNSIGGFDETFPYAALEDVDFHIRIKKIADVAFVKKALVIHPWRRIKPFSTFKKQLRSHRHFAKKYNMLNTLNFRWVRTKIFLGGIFANFNQLRKYSMRGWRHYLEMSLLNLCIIFI
jgi:GT2 family glycosyltransferase